MRRFVIWMMLCLLPLRLWAGDAMAVQHTPEAAPVVAMAMTPMVTVQAAHPCHSADTAMDASADAAPQASHQTKLHSTVHAKVHTSDHTSGNTAGTEHGSACGDCSVCHGPLAGLTVSVWAAKMLPAAVPQTMGWPALSATALPHLKPPRA